MLPISTRLCIVLNYLDGSLGKTVVLSVSSCLRKVLVKLLASYKGILSKPDLSRTEIVRSSAFKMKSRSTFPLMWKEHGLLPL